jgi:hypothetical protein
VGENSPDHQRIIDGRDQAELPAAGAKGEDVDLEDPAEQVGPSHPAALATDLGARCRTSARPWPFRTPRHTIRGLGSLSELQGVDTRSKGPPPGAPCLSFGEAGGSNDPRRLQEHVEPARAPVRASPLPGPPLHNRRPSRRYLAGFVHSTPVGSNAAVGVGTRTWRTTLRSPRSANQSAPARLRAAIRSTSSACSRTVSRLAASRDLERLVAELVGVLKKALAFDGLAVVLHDPARDKMVLHFAGGLTVPPNEVLTSPETDAAGVAWLTQQPIFVRDVEHEKRFPEIIELARAEGTRSFCVFSPDVPGAPTRRSGLHEPPYRCVPRRRSRIPPTPH